MNVLDLDELWRLQALNGKINDINVTSKVFTLPRDVPTVVGTDHHSEEIATTTPVLKYQHEWKA